MNKILELCILFTVLHLTSSQDCTLPQVLWGNWSTTNLGTMVITGSTPSLTFTKSFMGLPTVTEYTMNCRYISGTQYVLQSNATFYPFSSTSSLYLWMCIDFRQTSSYSFYYYLNSDQEAGFDGYRLVGRPATSTSVIDICTTTLNVAEFNSMIKIGYEEDAIDDVDCADPILGLFHYTYTDSSGTYCDNTNSSHISACNEWNRTHIYVNNTGCNIINPFYSDDGLLGCIANVHNSTSGVYYISLYNLDTSPTTKFICIAVTAAGNDTVFLSMKKTNCEESQSPTRLPTGGATMVLTAEYTCVKPTPTETKNYLWAIVLFPVLGFLLLTVIIIICLYKWLHKKEKIRAKKKKPLENGVHPMGEVSLAIDAPASMDREHGYIDTKGDLLHRPTERKKSFQDELLSEQSLNLNLDTNAWLQMDDTFTPSDVKVSLKQASKGSQSTSSRWRSKTKQFLTSKLVARGFKAPSSLNKRVPKSYAMSTTSSSMKTSSLRLKNGVHPLSNTEEENGSLPKLRNVTSLGSHKGSGRMSLPGSRAGSGVGPRLGPRRGSIDNLALTRKMGPTRSNSLVQLNTEKSPTKLPDMQIMPEEYVPETGVNEIIPTRTKPYNQQSLRDSYLSQNRRSNTMTSLQMPTASRKPWR